MYGEYSLGGPQEFQWLVDNGLLEMIIKEGKNLFFFAHWDLDFKKRCLRCGEPRPGFDKTRWAGDSKGEAEFWTGETCKSCGEKVLFFDKSR